MPLTTGSNDAICNVSTFSSPVIDAERLEELHRAMRARDAALRAANDGHLPLGGLSRKAYAPWAVRHGAPSVNEQLEAHEQSWVLAVTSAGCATAGRRPDLARRRGCELYLQSLRAQVLTERGEGDVGQTIVLSKLELDRFSACQPENEPSPSPWMLALVYGSVGRALASVRLRPVSLRDRALSDAIASAELERVSRLLGRAPSRGEHARISDLPASAVMNGRRWNEAMRYYGLTPSYPTPALPVRASVADEDATAEKAAA